MSSFSSLSQGQPLANSLLLGRNRFSKDLAWQKNVHTGNNGFRSGCHGLLGFGDGSDLQYKLDLFCGGHQLSALQKCKTHVQIDFGVTVAKRVTCQKGKNLENGSNSLDE